MSKPKLDLLATIQLKEITGVVGSRISKVQKVPLDADIRLFADGSCYPSKALVEEFQLEYANKGSDAPEYGFDIFETSKWSMWPENTDNFVMIAQVSKHAKKVDLFGKVTYDDQNQPRASVLNQGAGTFGKRLIGMLETTYGEELFKSGNSFVDLIIVRDSPISPAPNNIYNIPKLIVKGDKAGTYTYERRENLTIYPLIVGTELAAEAPMQDDAVGEIASLGTQSEPDSGMYADEQPLSLSDDEQKAEAALKEANDILGTEGQ